MIEDPDYDQMTFEQAYALGLHKQYVQFVKKRTQERIKANAAEERAEYEREETARWLWNRLRLNNIVYAPHSSVRAVLEAALREFFLHSESPEWRGSLCRTAVLLHQYDSEQTESFGSRLIEEVLRRVAKEGFLGAKLEGHNIWNERFVFPRID